MKIIEMYKRGMIISATFFLIMGICSIGVAVMCLFDLIIAGIIMGIFFALLNLKWLPSVWLDDKNEKNKNSQLVKKADEASTLKNEEVSVQNNAPKSEESAKTNVTESVSSTNSNTSNDKNKAIAEELSDNFVLVKYKKYKWYMSQNTPKTLADMPKKDGAGKFVTPGAKEKMFEAYVNFKPITREGDSRHVIKLDHYDLFDVYSNTIGDYFKMLDDSFMEEQVNPYVDKYYNAAMHAEYLKVKVNRKYEKTQPDGSKKCCVEVADIADKYIFEDEISVRPEKFDNFEEGKECAVLRIGWGVFFDNMNVYAVMKLEDVEKYIKK